jgi:predicted transcriptional regulator
VFQIDEQGEGTPIMDLKQGDLENIILNALWDLEEDGIKKIFVGDVQDRIKSIQKKWAYTTVKTVLDRLVDKDIAVRLKEGKKYQYNSVVTREIAGQLSLQKALRQFFRGDLDELQTCLNTLRQQQPLATPDAVAVVSRSYSHDNTPVSLRTGSSASGTIDAKQAVVAR